MRKRTLFLLLLIFLFACRREGSPPAPTATAIPDALAPTANGPDVNGATTTTPTTQAPTESASLYLPNVSGGPEETAATRAGSMPAATPSPTAVPPTPTPVYPRYEGPPLLREQIGVQVHLHRQDVPQLVAHLQALGAGWVKVQVKWAVFEPEAGRYEQELMDELDALVAQANAAGIKVLLGVAKAPEWSRPVPEMDGPPADYARFADFLAFLAGRYQEQVAAYELWNEANLQREWYGAPLSAADFVALIRAGAAGIRRQQSSAQIISGAPAVTGINDGVVAIDDRVFLQGMLEAGVGEVVDGIGVHPYGWANPPDATVAAPDPAASSHNDHPSFFFLDTLNQYHTLLQSYNVAQPLWVTEFGWGSFDQFEAPPPAEAAFMADVDEQQQARYLLRALEMAQERAWVGPMMLWNLNFAPVLGADFSVSGYSLLRPDGSPRPAYLALAAAPKQE